MINRKIQFGVIGALWLINPVYSGCSTATFTFEEADMLELMYDINESEWTIENDGTEFVLDFSLVQSAGEQASLQQVLEIMNSAHACGERSFVAEASACLDVSTLVMEGTVTITEKETQSIVVENMPIEGSMEVIGLDLTNAEIYLQHSAGDIYLYSNNGADITLDSAEW